MPTVLIRGEGIAASCCARLLHHAGLDLAIEALGRPKLPAVMLSDTTQRLLRDIFGHEDLFEGWPRIRRRVVAWGQDFKPLVLPHSAVVVSEEDLLKRIQHRFQDGIQDGPHRGEPLRREAAEWTILASSVSLPGRAEHHFGSRLASASLARLKPECDAETCWIESCENGWLFLLPTGNATAWLLCAGGPSESVLATSRLVQDQILELRPAKGTFASHARVMLPLSEPGWLACGTGALGFDPLCGDGVGNAAREAILGSALVRAAIDGDDIDSLVGYYQARLLSGFKRHVALCLEFYRSGGPGVWWERQVNDLERAMDCFPLHLSDRAASRYRLNGFSIERVE